MVNTETELELYFLEFRKNVIGNGKGFSSAYGKHEILYADWTASGRCYKPIEDCLQKSLMPYMANTHTESTITGTLMTRAYDKAKSIVKRHVNANDDEDILIFTGSGMTGAVNKLQRILGLRVPERILDYVKREKLPELKMLNEDPLKLQETFRKYLDLDETCRPVVFVTHMEHHSNQTSWIETIATVEIIDSDSNGNVDLEHLKVLLEKYKYKQNKIAAVTGCSNVTGIETPYRAIAKLIHKYNGLCFVDFACSAPYIQIDMHPCEEGSHLDAIYFSPHKFLGGPGTPGVLIFNKSIYKNIVPDQPGGGTVVYTNPWNFHEYITDIEHREDGGTPPFLQGIKVALAIKLKEKMGVEKMLKREKELLEIIFDKLEKIPNVQILEGHNKNRLGVVSFIVKDAHYNLIVKLLNDKFGIQTRGGCACAGTYGHKLLNVDVIRSYEVLNSIHSGNLLCKPGWIRLSIHPTMSTSEVNFIITAIEKTAMHFREWMKDYKYDEISNEYLNVVDDGKSNTDSFIDSWFNCSD